MSMIVWVKDCREGQQIRIGPDKDETYQRATVESIHKCKQPVIEAKAGDKISLALSILDSSNPVIKRVLNSSFLTSEDSIPIRAWS